MKKLKRLFIIMLLTSTFIAISSSVIINSQDSVYTSVKDTFVINSATNFTFYSTAPLTWESNKYTNYTMYFNATGVPTGENITLVSLAVYYNIPDDPHRKLASSFAIQFNLTDVNKQYTIIKPLRPPSDADEFNITVEVIAASTNSTENQLFEAEFPGDDLYIDIQKDVVLPVINLPGFPNIETFARWIFIFGVAFVIISLPAIFVATFKLKEFNENRKGKEKKDKTKTKTKKAKGGKKK